MIGVLLWTLPWTLLWMLFEVESLIDLCDFACQN